MTKILASKSLTKKQRKLWKQIAMMAAKTAALGPGISETRHFRNISKLLKRVTFTCPTGNADQEIASQQLSEKFEIFNGVFDKNLDPIDRMFLVDTAWTIAHSAEEIVKCREIIQHETGLLSVQNMPRQQLILSHWVRLDMLKYCWNDGAPRCSDMLGMLVSMAHNNAGLDGGCVQHFGTQTATDMFEASSPEGLQLFSSPIKGLDKPVRAYRACLSSTPEASASGMTWRLDLDSAFNWANNPRYNQKTTLVLSSIIKPEEVLASFNNDRELVVRPCARRQYQVVRESSGLDNKVSEQEEVQ